jgi:hypothetical protein
MDFIIGRSNSSPSEHEQKSNQLPSSSSFKPIPKPRKSLMSNENNSAARMPSAHTNKQVSSIGDAALSLANSKGRFLLNSSPPPLPPRTPFSSSSFPSATTTPENGNGNSINKIYPILEDFNEQPRLIATASKAINSHVPMDAADNSSEFSSEDYHSVLDSPAATLNLKPSIAYNSLYDPFGDVKSDGESVCFSGWVQLTPNGIIKHKKRGWAMIRKGQFFISSDEEVFREINDHTNY